MNITSKSYVKHMENENENEIKDKEKGVQGEKEDVRGSLVFYKADNLETELLKSEEWKNDMCLLSKTDPKKIDSLIHIFCIEQKHDQMGRTFREFRTHFMRWIIKKSQADPVLNQNGKFKPDEESKRLAEKYNLKNNG